LAVRHAGPQQLEILVVTSTTKETHPLPPSGRVTIGRLSVNDISVDDPSMSRRHAVLHIGSPLKIEDLGSFNGIRIRAQMELDDTARVVETEVPSGQTATLNPGDWITLGSTLLIVQHVEPEREPVSAKAGQLLTTPIVLDRAMRELYAMVERVSQGSISVLLLGETGVGKEVMAKAIHNRSPRSSRPFVCLNCASLSEALLESELFGHEAGAFTGAVKAKPGLLEIADTGTVFLDEVGEMPLSLQGKILRVLEDRQVLRVGGLKPRTVDVRFISATNRDLSIEVEDGTFRRDLYFRLNGISVTIPPLRERITEIEPLAKAFIVRACAQMRTAAVPTLSPGALEMLKSYSWPGNIRELRNVIERAVILCNGGTIDVRHILLERASIRSPTPPAVYDRTTLPPPPRVKKGADDERQRITDALERCAGNQTHAAELLGVSRRTFISRLEMYGISRPRKRT
jgi:transcriptional regulator with PAS, ATPase and Fis domain